MSEYLPIISIGLTVVIGIISFFIKRELDHKDKAITRLEERIHAVEQKVQTQEISIEKLSGKIDLVVQILERVEKRLEGMDNE